MSRSIVAVVLFSASILDFEYFGRLSDRMQAAEEPPHRMQEDSSNPFFDCDVNFCSSELSHVTDRSAVRSML